MEPPREHFERVLQECLELLDSDPASLNAVLNRYPEYEEELRPLLEARLLIGRLKNYVEPTPEFVSRSRNRLLTQIRRQRRASVAASLMAWLENLRLQRRLGWAVVAMLLVCSLLFGGTVSVARASQDSLPGEPLYPVKIGLERMAVAVTVSQDEDAQLQIDYTRRRLVEIQQLTMEGRFEHLPETVENLESQVTEALTTIDVVASRDQGNARELAATLRQTLKEQATLIDFLKDAVPAETRTVLDRAYQVSETAAEAAETVIRENEDEEDPDPTTEIPTATASVTPEPTATWTPMPTNTLTPTVAIATSTSVPVQGSEATLTPTSTQIWITLTPTPRPTREKDDDPTPEPTRTPTPTPTITPTPTPLTTPTLAPTAGPSPTPTRTGQPTPTIAPPEFFPTRTPSPTRPTQTPSPTVAFPGAWNPTPGILPTSGPAALLLPTLGPHYP